MKLFKVWVENHVLENNRSENGNGCDARLVRGHAVFSWFQGMIKTIMCFVFLLLPNPAAAEDSALSDDGRFVEEFLTNPDAKRDAVRTEFINVLKEIFQRCRENCKYSEFHKILTDDFGIQCRTLESLEVLHLKSLNSNKARTSNKKFEYFMLCYGNKIIANYIVQRFMNISLSLNSYPKTKLFGNIIVQFEDVIDLEVLPEKNSKMPIFLVTEIYSEPQIKNILRKGLIAYCKEALSDQCSRDYLQSIGGDKCKSSKGATTCGFALLTNNATRWKIKSSIFIGMNVKVTLKLAADGEVIHVGLKESNFRY